MARIYLLDTSAASDVMNGHSDAARQTLIREARSAVIAISAVTAGELRFGIRNRRSKRLQKAMDQFCEGAQILPWDDSVATAYADLRDTLARRGTPLDWMDLMIAAHALSVGAVLVTRDRDFNQVKDLITLVNWATDLE